MKSNIELHVHPFLGRNSLVDVISAMEDTRLDILALEGFNESIYPYIVEQIRKEFPFSQIGNAGVKLHKGKYLLNAREYDTHERLHVLTVGYSDDSAKPNTEIRKIIDNGLKNSALVVLDHPFIDNAYTKTAGHIPEGLEQELEKLCREYSGNIALEWNSYCIPWMRCVLKHGLNLVGEEILYPDVNQKAEELSEKLKQQGYNCPIVADTDLHARNRRHLQKMGTARIIAEVKGETSADLVASMKKSIFEGNYENIKRYVSAFHLLRAFCLPILFPDYFKKPRA